METLSISLMDGYPQLRTVSGVDQSRYFVAPHSRSGNSDEALR